MQQVLLCAEALNSGFDIGAWGGSGTQYRFSNPYLPDGVHQGQVGEASTDNYSNVFVPRTTRIQVAVPSEGERRVNIRIAFFRTWVRAGISRFCQNQNQDHFLQISRCPVESSRSVDPCLEPQTHRWITSAVKIQHIGRQVRRFSFSAGCIHLPPGAGFLHALTSRSLRGRNDRSEKVGNRGQIFSILRCIVVLFAEKSGKIWGRFYRFRSRSISAAQAP